MLTEALIVLFTAIFVNNFVVVQFLGLCPFMGASQRISSAVGMASATLFVLTLSAGISYLIEHYILLPFDLTALRILTFIILIAGLVQFMEIVIRATQPLLHEFLGVYIPLITTNCMVLGVALINIRTSDSFFGAVLLGLGAGLGFGLLLVIFAALRERQSGLSVPKPFQGAAINMITAGLIALAFSGLTAMSFS